MHIVERARVYHRVWRYRLRTERQEIAYMLSRDLRGATMADIGANRGAYSYWMHKAVASHGHVIAFEPQPELVAYLQDLSSSFGLKQLRVVEAALSSSIGERQLVRPKEHWGGGSLQLEPDARTEVLTVATTTLDHYFGESSLRPLRFIKADIQGHEYDCFVGGERILKDDRPDILCEILDPELESVRSYLTSLNYEGYFFFKNNLTPISKLKKLRSSIAAPFLNYVFVPSKRAVSDREDR